MPNTTYNNTDGDNYNYDDTKIEFVGGVEKLLASSGTPEAYMYVTMDDNVLDDVFRDLSGNSRDGALKGGLSGAINKVPAKINNGLQGISTSQGFVDFGIVDFSFEHTDAFSIELWIKTTSTASMTLVSKQNSVSPFNGYSLTMLSGKTRCVIRDTANKVISKEFSNTINNNIFHHVVFTYDGSGLVSGMNLYVDNTENDTIVASDTITNTITNNFPFQISGRNANNNCIDSNTILDEVVVYARELTAAEVAYRWNNGNGTQTLPGADVQFPTDNPSSIPNVGFQATGITSFSATVVETGLDTITFTVVVDGTDYYWDGADWAESSGYPDTNSASVINANLATLPITGLSSINFRVYFHSADGGTTPELDDFTVGFDIQPTRPEFTQSVITGSIYDIGLNTSDIEITIKPVRYLFGSTSIITNAEIDVSYDINTGVFVATIYVENVSPDELIWKFGSKEVRTKYLSGSIGFDLLPRIYS